MPSIWVEFDVHVQMVRWKHHLLAANTKTR
jgi:hypothetical protein